MMRLPSWEYKAIVAGGHCERRACLRMKKDNMKRKAGLKFEERGNLDHLLGP